MTLQGQAARENDKAAGVILLQIDGLSRHQLHKALDVGRLPFLNRRRIARKLRKGEGGLHA